LQFVPLVQVAPVPVSRLSKFAPFHVAFPSSFQSIQLGGLVTSEMAEATLT